MKTEHLNLNFHCPEEPKGKVKLRQREIASISPKNETKVFCRGGKKRCKQDQEEENVTEKTGSAHSGAWEATRT